MSRIAIVHDYFTQQGGAERVVEQLHRMLPVADLFATVSFKDTLPPALTDVDVRTSWMQKLPSIKKLHRLYFPIYPLGVQALDLREYDLVVTSSSGYAKGVRTSRDAIHICYCHTPMRWVWRFGDYAERENFGFSKRLLLPISLRALKLWDIDAARQPDQFIANSYVVAERIEKVYGRKPVVIHPPIDLDRFHISRKQDDYYLVLSRLVSYKRIDLAIQACNHLGRRLIIVGDGPDRKRLEAVAGPTVVFTGRLSDSETTKYAGECRALLFPGEEDFGMVPLELAAAGRPAIAFRAGGATETVIDGVTGVFFDKPDFRSLADAIVKSESLTWSPDLLRKHAAGFDVNVFRSKFTCLMNALGVLPDQTKTLLQPVVDAA